MEVKIDRDGCKIKSDTDTQKIGLQLLALTSCYLHPFVHHPFCLFALNDHVYCAITEGEVEL